MKKYLIVGSMVLCCSAMIASDTPKQEEEKPRAAQVFDLLLKTLLEKPSKLGGEDYKQMSDIISNPDFSFEKGGAADIIVPLMRKRGVAEKLVNVALVRGQGRPVKFLVEMGLVAPNNVMELFLTERRGKYPPAVIANAGAYLLSKIADEDGDIKNYLNEQLFRAIHYYRIPALKLFLEHGANPNLQGGKYGGIDFHGATPLTSAIGTRDANYINFVRLLLKAGADPNLKDGQGDTPLALAVLLGDGEIVEMLVEAGADPNMPDNSGGTPLQTAEERGMDEIAEMLRGALAEKTVEL